MIISSLDCNQRTRRCIIVGHKHQFQLSGLYAASLSVLLYEGDIGRYPIPQCRKKNWQIPKYRVENRRNTDTAFMMGHAYLKLYASRVSVYFKYVCTRNQPQPFRDNARRPRCYRCNDRKARSLDATTIPL